MTKFNEQEASWDYAQVWSKFPVPARPSTEELQYLEKEIKPLGLNINLLILGSTIEYRSLSKRLGIHPYVADFDKSIYEVLTNYSTEKFDEENFLQIDWLELDYENKFDVVVGHRPFNVIGKETMAKFFRRMYQSLKPDGVFYCKGNVRPGNHRDQLESLIKKWAFEPKRKYPLFSYIEVELYFHCADKDGYVDYPRAREVAAYWIEKGMISRQDYDLIKILISMSGGARFCGSISDAEIRNAISSAGFKQFEMISLDKDICANMPIIKMTK